MAVVEGRRDVHLSPCFSPAVVWAREAGECGFHARRPPVGAPARADTQQSRHATDKVLTMRTPFTMDSAGFLTLLDALERRVNNVTAASSLSVAGIDGALYPVVQPARAGEEDCADRGESAA